MYQKRQQRAARMTGETLDMIGNVNDILNMYQQMRANPMQFLSQRFNLPQDLNDPNSIIQHLLNTGQVTQTQVNNANAMRNNPLIQRLIQK